MKNLHVVVSLASFICTNVCQGLAAVSFIATISQTTGFGCFLVNRLGHHREMIFGPSGSGVHASSLNYCSREGVHRRRKWALPSSRGTIAYDHLDRLNLFALRNLTYYDYYFG